MFINTASNIYSTQAMAYSSRNAQTSPTTVAASTTKADTFGAKQVDFSNMTRQEMRDWVNGQIRSGEMSLDDSRPFMAMTMKIPIAGGTNIELPTDDDSESIDFTQRINDGIEGALSRNDQTTLKMLESAMQIMKRNQGQTIGIDAHA